MKLKLLLLGAAAVGLAVWMEAFEREMADAASST